MGRLIGGLCHLRTRAAEILKTGEMRNGRGEVVTGGPGH